MNKINTHLNRIQKNTIKEDIVQEDIVQEFDPLLISTLMVGTMVVVMNLTLFFLNAFIIINQLKISKDLSMTLNKVLKSGNKWIVHIYKGSEPNAFTFGFGRHIIVSTKLLNMLNEREMMAVLLHESYHNTKKHAYKDMAIRYPFLYLCISAIMFVGTTSGAIFVGPVLLLIIYLISKVAGITKDILIGRRMEYNADSFAAKYGYGKELISSLKKIEKWVNQYLSKVPCGKICQMMRKIDKAIDEHPQLKNRIENILKDEKNLKKILATKSFGKVKSFLLKKFEK